MDLAPHTLPSLSDRFSPHDSVYKSSDGRSTWVDGGFDLFDNDLNSPPRRVIFSSIWLSFGVMSPWSELWIFRQE